jgi:hypothetical protein
MVTVPISIRLPRDTIDYIIRDSGAALLFCDRDRREFHPAEIPAVDFDDASYAAAFTRLEQIAPKRSAKPSTNPLRALVASRQADG